MQQIILQKNIKAKYPIDGITLVNLEEEIEYKNTSEGVYATGVIKINGEYYKGIRNNKFYDEIDVDIFAPLEDLGDRSNLRVKILDFDYKIHEDQLLIDIILNLDGLKDVTKTFPATDKVEEKEEDILEENVIVRGDDNAPIIEEETVKIVENETPLEMINTNPSKIKKNSNFPIQFQKNKMTNKVCWSYHVVLKDDTYESISKELNIDVEKLKTLNNFKELSEGLLLMVP